MPRNPMEVFSEVSGGGGTPSQGPDRTPAGPPGPLANRLDDLPANPMGMFGEVARAKRGQTPFAPFPRYAR